MQKRLITHLFLIRIFIGFESALKLEFRDWICINLKIKRMKNEDLEKIEDFEKSILHYKKLSYILYALIIAEVCIVTYNYINEGLSMVTIASLSMFLCLVSLTNLCLLFKSNKKIDKLLFEIVSEMLEEFD